MPWAGHRRAVAVGYRVTVPVDLHEGDAVVVDEAPDHGPELVKAAAATFGHALGELLPRRPDVPRRVDELVVAGRGRAPDVEERLLGARRAVSGQHVVADGRTTTGTADGRVGSGSR